MNHTIPVALPFGRASVVRWALRPRGGLLVFVHGFRGSARKTWGGLPDRLVVDPRFEGHDLVFFDYDSKRRQVQFWAYELRSCLTRLLRDTAGALEETGCGALEVAGREYESLDIVAHSLGAIISRRALLDEARTGGDSFELARLHLFAPAHMGARVRSLVHLTLAPVPLLEALARTVYPCLDELEPGSGTLERLAADSQQMTDHSSDGFVIAASVFGAEIEQVVHTTPFLADPPGEPIFGTDHMSVCKYRDSRPSLADKLWMSLEQRAK